MPHQRQERNERSSPQILHFYRVGLKNILMREMPAEHPDGPPTEGPWPATSGARREVHSVHELIRDVHKHGSDDAAH